jgi:hypothetical protein
LLLPFFDGDVSFRRDVPLLRDDPCANESAEGSVAVPDFDDEIHESIVGENRIFNVEPWHPRVSPDDVLLWLKCS